MNAPRLLAACGLIMLASGTASFAQSPGQGAAPAAPQAPASNTVSAQPPASAPTAFPAQSWTPRERIDAYQVEGQTGIALYESIGARGPQVGVGRVIAYTTFDLKWSRDYRPENGGCRLAAAKPHLTIIYKLPLAPKQLPEKTRSLWTTFIAGIEKHERVHGAQILDLVRQIEAVSVGMFVSDDPKCQKIRQQLTEKLAILSQAQRAKSRDFDKVEMSNGGNVHQLILALVNG